MQDRGDVLESDAHQKPREEAVPFLHQRELLVDVQISPSRKERLSLHLDEGGGDQQELRSDLDVHVLHLVEDREVLGDDRREPDRGHFEVVPGNQLEEQVEWPLEHGRLDVKRHRLAIRLFGRANGPRLWLVVGLPEQPPGLWIDRGGAVTVMMPGEVDHQRLGAEGFHLGGADRAVVLVSGKPRGQGRSGQYQQ